MDKQKERESRFELLRILAMLMVVGSHYAAHGIELCTAEGQAYQIWGGGSLLHRLFTAFLNPGGEVGVALLLMISGYFQVKKEKPRLTRLVLECYFYALISLLLLAGVLLCGGAIPGMDRFNLLAYVFRAVLIPVSSTCWWFVAMYLFVMLLSPVLNRFLLGLNREGFRLALLACFLLWYCAAMLVGTEFFGLQKAIFFYGCGAYFRLHRQEEKRGCGTAVLLLLAALLGWGLASFGFFESGEAALGRGPFRGGLAGKALTLAEAGIGAPLCAGALFEFFKDLKLGYKPFVNRVAATTFGVYLLHDSLIARPLIWQSWLKVAERQYGTKLYPLYAVLTVLLLFALCSALDALRLRFLEPGALKWAARQQEKLKKRYSVSENGKEEQS